MIEEKDTTLAELIRYLRELNIADTDFARPADWKQSVHEKVVKEISGWWEEKTGRWAPQPGAYGIDVVCREERARGKILLAVEVDRSDRAEGSWLKLTDIRSQNKVWLFLSNRPNAELLFNEAADKFRGLLRSRKDDEDPSFGSLVLVMKTPTAFEVKRIL